MNQTGGWSIKRHCLNLALFNNFIVGPFVNVLQISELRSVVTDDMVVKGGLNSNPGPVTSCVTSSEVLNFSVPSFFSFVKWNQ